MHALVCICSNVQQFHLKGPRPYLILLRVPLFPAMLLAMMTRLGGGEGGAVIVGVVVWCVCLHRTERAYTDFSIKNDDILSPPHAYINGPPPPRLSEMKNPPPPLRQTPQTDHHVQLLWTVRVWNELWSEETNGKTARTL